MEKRIKLLIANDSAEFNRDYGRIFEQSGMEIIYTQKDGMKLLEKIESVHPDVVLADLFMPRLDGIGVMKATQAKAPDIGPMFVIISNFTSPALEREVMMSGAAYFAISPFNAADLSDRIIQLCSLSGLTQKAPVRQQTPAAAEPSLEIQVTEILHQIGVPAHIKGYHYLRDSIIMAIETPDIINAVTKQLYPSVAKQYDTTASRVERAIRHAIEVAWDRGDVDILNSYFGYTIHNTRGKPTNSEFIAMISDRLRLHMKSAS
ncbi:sporulation transcription factor Spo0A [Caproiciproducens faecalis]|uniref:Stage 0 sporulation protein A homolog n=1 Tax=Caproiciproducens faecalis TaxID=2820301 RepID=A0ABS7DS19_9FIRM|nr:sporulation transcription factor Spo0A [Caproiciproducens faecalis]MBW7573605.1 sporulation transcription factor Spo0A [Caproiciproducens faecalis]